MEAFKSPRKIEEEANLQRREFFEGLMQLVYEGVLTPVEAKHVFEEEYGIEQ